jgi:hypothetical protein
MTVTIETLRDELDATFGRVREEFIEARRRHQTKDTPDNRSAVRECLAQIDRVLDMYLEMGPASLG